MSTRNVAPERAYGIGKDLLTLHSLPIVSVRNPTVNDRADYGQVWINKSSNAAYTLTSKNAGQSIWATHASTAVGNFVAGGSVTSTTTMVCGTGLTVSAGGAAITGNSTVTGSLASTTTLASGTTLTAGSSLSVTTSAIIGTNLTLTAGNLLLSLGNATLTAGNLLLTLGNLTMTNGNFLITAGNATLTNGELTISTATKGVTLPGAVRIMTGAGAPANGLATAIGCLYIRTDAGAAAERVYVATAVNAWTNISAAA